MQDLQRLFGGGERRLLKTQTQQGLKCPRCDSLNTKFCYYNNYNLSQPRFFCKGCRRYWTNGGVLRNVPVGGGCRKTKVSKQKSGNGNSSSVRVARTSELKSSDSQYSSSDSSPTFTQTCCTLSGGTPTLFSPNQLFDPPLLDTGDQNVFSDMETFGSLITSCSDYVKIDDSNSLGFVGEAEYSRPTNQGRVAATADQEDWRLFDQSYWLNNFDHQSDYFP